MTRAALEAARLRITTTSHPRARGHPYGLPLRLIARFVLEVAGDPPGRTYL
ncbi:hypothetical protein [Rubrivirga sp.]|uniref:hypothetical protein n=1 Tax=Rubrivirga sp. TaxID=1885344 RepID=UPI003C765697